MESIWYQWKQANGNITHTHKDSLILAKAHVHPSKHESIDDVEEERKNMRDKVDSTLFFSFARHFLMPGQLNLFSRLYFSSSPPAPINPNDFLAFLRFVLHWISFWCLLSRKGSDAEWEDAFHGWLLSQSVIYTSEADACNQATKLNVQTIIK